MPCKHVLAKGLTFSAECVRHKLTHAMMQDSLESCSFSPPGAGVAPVVAAAVTSATGAASAESVYECVICMAAEIETMLAPCGHQALCW